MDDLWEWIERTNAKINDISKAIAQFEFAKKTTKADNNPPTST